MCAPCLIADTFDNWLPELGLTRRLATNEKWSVGVIQVDELTPRAKAEDELHREIYDYYYYFFLF